MDPAVLQPLYEPFPSTIKFSYCGEEKDVTPEAEAGADFYAWMIDEKCRAMSASLYKKIYESLKKVMTDEEKELYINPDMFDFSYLLGYLQVQADLRKKMTKEEKDRMKYETARKLKKRLPKIRDSYKEDWESKEMRNRQRGVALYFIDELALRVGNHATPCKDNYIAGTVGCCSLRVEHIKLTDETEKGFCIEFNFPGKNSIQFEHKLRVKDIVFKNIQQLFKEAKKHELFHLVTPCQLNIYLQKLMPGLTTKVFRTCHASIILQEKLEDLTAAAGDSLPSKLQAYNQAVEAAAVLCNHKRAVSKTSDKQMANQQDKIKKMETELEKTKGELKYVRNEKKQSKNKNKKMKQLDKRERELEKKLKDQVAKLKEAKNAEKSYESNVTTTINYYLDPRIIVAWYKKWEVPVEEIYSPALMQKFKWAIDMAEDLLDYEF